MRIGVICFFYLIVGCNYSNPTKPKLAEDDFYEKCRKLVLSEKQIGQEYFFSRKVQGVDEISILYLGDIITTQKDTLHILNSINYSGQLSDAKHGNGNVFIYQGVSKKIGYYYVGSAFSVPSKIENGSLIFSYANELCNQSTVVSLKDSIPKQIFINCTSKGGDLYTLSIED